MKSSSSLRAGRAHLFPHGKLTLVEAPPLNRWAQTGLLDVARMLSLALVYYVAALLSLRMALVGDQVTPVWPPTGIAVVALLLFGPRLWPGIALGAVLVNAPIGPSMPAVVAIAVGNTLAPVLAASWLRRAGFRKELDRLRDVVLIVFDGALFGMVVSATIGATTLVATGGIAAREFLPTWSVWWVGDAMGVLLFAPLLLTLMSDRERSRSTWRQRAEAAALLTATAVASHVVFRSGLHIAFLVFPLLGWTAWRLGQPGAAAAALLASAPAIWAAVDGAGPFAREGLLGKMLTLQVFNASVALFAFVLAAIKAERVRNLSERQRVEAELLHQALHDPLTGLANRTLFMDRLSQGLARSSRRRGSVAVMFLDLDRFKLINDSLGHAVGDHVLRSMAGRLSDVLRSEDTASRFGGDEFVVLCEIDSDEDVILIADRIAQAVARPVPVEGGEVVVTTSIGIAVAKGATDAPEELVRNADSALYRAKERGRARYELFDQRMRTRAVNRLTIENELRRAIEHGELCVYYQPLVRIHEARIVAWEGLVRWEHPVRGLLGPGEFIPVAEETGLISPLGAWVLEEVCHQWARWNAAHRDAAGLRMAVNLSTQQLGSPQFMETVRAALAAAEMAPGNLSLEITESVFMEPTPPVLATVRGLSELGVQFSIDDFGTGYSSLAYLKRIPVDALKVDRSFIDGLGQDRDDAAIVRATVGLAHALSLSAVAEGVETAKQLDYLQLIGCDVAQGYYFGRPQPADALEDVVTSGLALR